MQKQESLPKNIRGLLTIGLAAGLVLAFPDIKAIFVP